MFLDKKKNVLLSLGSVGRSGKGRNVQQLKWLLLHDFKSLNRLLRNGKLKIRYKAAVM
jgi:hypothetical protein